MKKIIGTIFICIYVIIAVSVTVLLLSYNEYKVSEINGYSICIMGDESLEPEYKHGDLLIAKKTNKNKIKVGDNVLLYKTISTNEFEIVNRKVENILTEGNHLIYQVSDDEQYDSEYLIAKDSDITRIENLGTVLGILESRWGYLFFIVIVSLILLLQEIFELVMEVKYGNMEIDDIEKENENIEIDDTEKATENIELDDMEILNEEEPKDKKIESEEELKDYVKDNKEQ